MSYAVLIERLEKLEGPDREADAEIERIVGEAPRKLRAGPAMRPQCPPYSFSIDTAVALVERLGFQWPRKSPVAMTVYRPLTREQDERKEWAVHHSAAGATPAIALLIATLKALDQQHD